MKSDSKRAANPKRRPIPAAWYDALQLIAPLLALVAVILFVVFIAL